MHGQPDVQTLVKHIKGALTLLRCPGCQRALLTRSAIPAVDFTSSKIHMCVCWLLYDSIMSVMLQLYPLIKDISWHQVNHPNQRHIMTPFCLYLCQVQGKSMGRGFKTAAYRKPRETLRKVKPIVKHRATGSLLTLQCCVIVDVSGKLFELVQLSSAWSSYFQFKLVLESYNT